MVVLISCAFKKWQVFPRKFFEIWDAAHGLLLGGTNSPAKTLALKNVALSGLNKSRKEKRLCAHPPSSKDLFQGSIFHQKILVHAVAKVFHLHTTPLAKDCTKHAIQRTVPRDGIE